ncbi:tRNA (adenosine(37)-N6)-threonylcarbamoyltransferase complex ATPase subunit type 1 TsaE [Paenibacillus sp. GYB004]|uniref:tRNA (adenosine(37)-N6)-threonylcarbamoyltransferase complex ATPase subunit type 1 TsaE n=1 Tax=Paenibacillus sp. GYB004 TaxID=2994393 RepID=UPI002F96E01B
MYRYESNNEEQTAKLAEALSAMMEAGTVVALDGDLGAGKTRFSQSVARALGVPGVVNSPTFTIIKEYEGDRLPFYHMDVYRISEDEADELGLDDYFYGEGVTLVEWAELIRNLLPPDRLAIYISHAGETRRVMELRPYGARYNQWCNQLKENGILS